MLKLNVTLKEKNVVFHSKEHFFVVYKINMEDFLEKKICFFCNSLDLVGLKLDFRIGGELFILWIS